MVTSIKRPPLVQGVVSNIRSLVATHKGYNDYCDKVPLIVHIVYHFIKAYHNIKNVFSINDKTKQQQKTWSFTYHIIWVICMSVQNTSPIQNPFYVVESCIRVSRNMEVTSQLGYPFRTWYKFWLGYSGGSLLWTNYGESKGKQELNPDIERILIVSAHNCASLEVDHCACNLSAIHLVLPKHFKLSDPHLQL